MGVKEADTQPLYEAVNILREWLQKELESERLKRHTHEIYCEIWNGIETMAIMKDLKLDPNSVEILKVHFTNYRARSTFLLFFIYIYSNITKNWQMKKMRMRSRK